MLEDVFIPRKTKFKIKYGDEFLDRFLQEFTVSEARSFIENVVPHCVFIHIDTS